MDVLTRDAFNTLVLDEPWGLDMDFGNSFTCNGVGFWRLSLRRDPRVGRGLLYATNEQGNLFVLVDTIVHEDEVAGVVSALLAQGANPGLEQVRDALRQPATV